MPKPQPGATPLPSASISLLRISRNTACLCPSAAVELQCYDYDEDMPAETVFVAEPMTREHHGISSCSGFSDILAKFYIPLCAFNQNMFYFQLDIFRNCSFDLSQDFRFGGARWLSQVVQRKENLMKISDYNNGKS